jgi:hypothetical protein
LILLGITGRAETGKTTVGKAIVKTAVYLELNAKVYELSNCILAEAIQLGTIQPKTRQECTPEDIQELIRLGAQGRKQDQQYWMKLLLQEMEKDKPDVAVCPNVRFTQESEFIQSRGGKVVRVTALNPDGAEYVSRSRDPNDPSETSQRLVVADYYLTTKRGESDLLKMQAETLFKYLYGRRN